MFDVVFHWGSTARERGEPFPGDRFLAEPDVTLYRAVDVGAPAGTLYGWLCQLRVAPYSYDWIDNRGRRSPRRRDPALVELASGQRFMTIFRLVDFEAGRHVTLRHRGALFGEVVCSYRIAPNGPSRCRLVVKVTARYPPRSPLRQLLRAVLPAGDLVMMRRQLRNLAALAEREVRRPGAEETTSSGPGSP